MADPATKGQSSSQRRKKHDDFVMATNSSSIVSKRSVERLYYPEPHVFRHFVKKPIRRSPLINREYTKAFPFSWMLCSRVSRRASSPPKYCKLLKGIKPFDRLVVF